MTLTPPAVIPPELLSRYTLDGRIPMTSMYLDNTSIPRKSYSRDDIERLIAIAEARGCNYYGATDSWLYSALAQYPIADKKVGILGSLEPWYESVCLAFLGRPVTVEYNKVEYDHPGIRAMTVAEYTDKPEQFDAAFSISSFEHDGLGRYGDPIDPDGDIEAMSGAMAMLKPGGLLYLSIPVGHDELVWNAHRVYGSLRLPMLLSGWTQMNAYGLPPNVPYTRELQDWIQPVFVLRKPKEL